MADRIGQQLGNYRIMRLLGSGGFAEVYLGAHIYLKSQAALKVLRTSLSDKDVQRFLAEAQTLVRLRHPHIVRVLEFAVEQGTPVLIMDYAPGGIIRETYPSGSRLPLKVVVTYVKQIASALQYAHNHNVIHRDVKPENILLGPEQELLLSDFGLSLLTASPDLLSTQEMAGTIPYMAPEQLHGKPVFASDQYALGIVTYEWLCGIRPFTGTIWEIAQQHLSVAPPSLREKCPELPVEVEDVVLKALAKEPQQRFVSVQAFAHALARASQVSMLQESAQASIIVSERSEAAFATQPDQSLRRIFLAASPADESFAIRLKTDLEARGMLVESTRDTPDQEEKLRQAIRAAQFVLAVASPHMRSSRTLKEYLRIASMYERQLVFVWAAGDDIAALLPEGWGKAAVIDVIDAREGRYEVALDELVASLEAEEELSVTSPLEPFLSQAEGQLPEPRNPYKGLRAFTEDDATDFFGRDALIQELVDAIQNMLAPAQSAQPGTTGASLLTVIGPSGSGKSSVVMAGLLPQLQDSVLSGSEEWVFLDPIVPGQHPLEALTLTLASHFPSRSLTTVREDLQDDATRGLHLLAASLMQKPDTKVVLVVDQFEEIFTQTTAEDERRRFIDLLVTAVTEQRGPLIVILTLRANFYDRLAQYPELGRLIQKRNQMVFPMEIQDLRAIIEQPATLPDVQLTFEGNLVGDLLFEAQGQVGALPLLEFTLDQLFQQRNGHQLTLDAYQKIGGVKGALAKHAEATYASLPSEEHRRLARALFLRLIDPGVTEQDTTRRRTALSELSLPDARQTTIIKEVTDAFIAARLLITNEIAGTTTVEVSHEALIREWKRLADWVSEAREDIQLQQAISEDVAEWERRGKPKDRLYRGSQLKEARTWAGRNLPSQKEVAFLRAGTTQRRRFVVNITALSLVLMLILGLAIHQLFVTRPSIPDPTHVTNLNDSGPGSLRQAIVAASPGNTITFDASLRGKTILLNDTLDITKNLTVRGPGFDNLSISYNTFKGLDVFKGNSVTIMGLAFKGIKNPVLNPGIPPGTNTEGVVNSGTLILIDSIVSDNAMGGILNDGTLTLRNSAVSNNQGTGIDNSGTLSIINSTISGNRGGGISNDSSGGTLTLQNSTVSGNGNGGISNSGTLTVSDSTISGNAASYGSSSIAGGLLASTIGGGIVNEGTLTITNSTISGNTVPASTTHEVFSGGPHYSSVLLISGGGIINSIGIDGNSTKATLTIADSTISGNTAFSNNSIIDNSNNPPVKFLVTNGGGITNYGGALTITDSTISGNTASTTSGFNGATFSNGGGISNYGGKADVISCTIYNNHAQDGASDIFTGNGIVSGGNQIPGRAQMRNSIVADNHANSTPEISGTLITYGYNLIQNFSGVKFDDLLNKHSTDISGDKFPNLGISSMLGNNGGPTETYALLPGSPAIDQIPLNECAVMTDQRGVKRPQGFKCDIGAYEYQPSS